MKKIEQLFFYLLTLFLSGCSDIYHLQRGDHLFNQSNYQAAIQEYEKVVSLTSERKSPYYGLPTGEEAKKKIELSQLALQSKENFVKGNEEFWKGRFTLAAQFYKQIDPQYLSLEENAVYEKNRKEILNFLSERLPASDSSTLAKKKEESPSALRKLPSEVSQNSPLDAEPSLSDYYPLSPGWKYHYRTSIPIGQRVIFQNSQEEVLPEKILKERKVIPVEKRQQGKLTETFYYEIRNEEVRLVAEQKTPQDSVTFLESPILEIKFPLKVGNSWTVQGKPRVILGKEEVETASGKYSNCLKIMEQEGELVRITRWYAPGVGLVKLQKTTFPGKPHESQQIMELVKIEK